MKAIRCELCDSTDIIKQGDLFVCQHCGAKYEPEAARKLMVELDAPETAAEPSEDSGAAPSPENNAGDAEGQESVSDNGSAAVAEGAPKPPSGWDSEKAHEAEEKVKAIAHNAKESASSAFNSGKQACENKLGKKKTKVLGIAVAAVALVILVALIASCAGGGKESSSSSSLSSSSSSSGYSSSQSSSSSSDSGYLTDSELERKAVAALYSELKEKASIWKDLDPGSCKYEIGTIERNRPVTNDTAVNGKVYFVDKYGGAMEVMGHYSQNFTVYVSSYGSTRCDL